MGVKMNNEAMNIKKTAPRHAQDGLLLICLNSLSDVVSYLVVNDLLELSCKVVNGK